MGWSGCKGSSRGVDGMKFHMHIVSIDFPGVYHAHKFTSTPKLSQVLLPNSRACSSITISRVIAHHLSVLDTFSINIHNKLIHGIPAQSSSIFCWQWKLRTFRSTFSAQYGSNVYDIALVF